LKFGLFFLKNILVYVELSIIICFVTQ